MFTNIRLEQIISVNWEDCVHMYVITGIQDSSCCQM